MRVHIKRVPEAQDLETLQSLLDPQVEISLGEIDENCRDVRILVAGRPTGEQLDAFPNLEALIVPWTGISYETLELVRRRPGLSLHNLHHNAPPVAELAVALLLAAAKYIIPHDRALRQGDWSMRYQDPSSLLLAGKKALILGYGKIGQLIGMALEGMGVEVYAASRSGQGSHAQLFSVEVLPVLLPETEFLILALPLTLETEGLIGKRELDLLPGSAIIVNIARGRIVDQEALYQALHEGRIAGAGLDVWYNYPKSRESRSDTLPADFPFHELENVVLSPHRGGSVRETETLRMNGLAELLNDAAAGRVMGNQVDIERGY